MSQDKFFNMLSKVPRLEHLWDKEKRSLDVPSFEAELNVLSSGEVHMAKFFAAVWFGNNTQYGFDLVDAVREIDPAKREVVMQWMSAPFWP